MADLSKVVSFLAFCEPGRGASWILDLRGPGRFAGLGLEKTQWVFQMTAVTKVMIGSRELVEQSPGFLIVEERVMQQ